MNLSKKSVDLILETTHLCTILGIDGMILDDEGIRGYNEDEGVIVASLHDYGFEFDEMAVARLSSLRQKFKLLDSLTSFTVDAVEKGDTGVIEKLIFASGNIDFEFRCATVKSVKDINGKKLNTKPVHAFYISEEEVATISKAANAMRSKTMLVEQNEKGIRFRFSDESGDVLTIKADMVQAVSSAQSDNFSFTINLSKMLPIFKMAVRDEKILLNILKNNIMHVVVGKLDVLVIPEV